MKIKRGLPSKEWAIMISKILRWLQIYKYTDYSPKIFTNFEYLVGENLIG